MMDGGETHKDISNISLIQSRAIESRKSLVGQQTQEFLSYFN